ncbi:hypothetical protein [Cellulosimicrobium sp. Marseille-Q4280]|uniref:hypothetical protein n=1 Tax=Cellulosimicrobium sp. Marseille-Q4280 TaxID=2937992 RepID=UPI00203ACB68|nr:hypothetical protein [Cellulosimicrobium sp. Marseille-Q4280]
MSTQSRVPAGVTTGGQFSTSARGEADVHLEAADDDRVCVRCGEEAGYLSSDDRCDGCLEQVDAERTRLTTLTPPEADTELVQILNSAVSARREVDYALGEVHRAVGDRQTWERKGPVWGLSHADAEAKARELADSDLDPDDENYYRAAAARKAVPRYDAATLALALLDEQNALHEAEFARRGGWTRAFLATSTGGHVHASMGCSTCNRGESPTEFQLMTDYSGTGEDTIVADAGYRACTVCFPSAPVGDATSLPTKMLSTDEVAKAAARTEREAKKAKAAEDRIAKGLTADGSPLRVEWTETNAPGWDPVPGGRPGERTHTYRDRPAHEEFKTERAATQWYVETLAWGYGRAEDKAPALEAVAQAIAVKRGVDVETVKAELAKKVEAKKKRG